MMKYLINNEFNRLTVNRAVDNLDLAFRWVVKIDKERHSRSLDQNELYWKWVEIIGDEYGNFKDDQHEILMRLLLKPRMIDNDGEIFHV